MISSRLFRSGACAALFACGLAATAPAASAQAGSARSGTPAGPPPYVLAPSGRAVTTVEFAVRMPANTPADQRPAPKRISIDYGQPHARGRDVLPLIPTSSPWRAGANTSTTFTTDVDMTINGLSVPKGTYSLYVQREAAGAKLIINKQTTQWGTVYDGKQDLGRVDLRVRTLSQPLDALQIVLAPAATGSKGVLRIVWGTIEMETDWEARP